MPMVERLVYILRADFFAQMAIIPIFQPPKWFMTTAFSSLES